MPVKKAEARNRALLDALDQMRRRQWTEQFIQALKESDGPAIVCGPVSYFPDDEVAFCDSCTTEVSIRGWLRKRAMDHGLRIICIYCALTESRNGASEKKTRWC